MSKILPHSATLPIFIFVAFEIVAAAYSPPPNSLYHANYIFSFHDQSIPRQILTHHAPAIIFAFFPAMAQVMQIILSQLYNAELIKSAQHPEQVFQYFNNTVPEPAIATIGVVVILAHGFIFTSLLWGSALAFVIDKKLGKATLMLILCAVSIHHSLSIFS